MIPAAMVRDGGPPSISLALFAAHRFLNAAWADRTAYAARRANALGNCAIA